MEATCSAAAAQYGSPGWLVQHPCVSGGSLPFTGINLIWIILFGVGMLCLGIGLCLQAQAQR